MFHLQLHASCTKSLLESAVESHFLGEHLSLLKLEILFSFCAVLFFSHYVLNILSKKSGLGLVLLHRYIYLLELRKKTLDHWKPCCTTFTHGVPNPNFSQILSLDTKSKGSPRMPPRWSLSQALHFDTHSRDSYSLSDHLGVRRRGSLSFIAHLQLPFRVISHMYATSWALNESDNDYGTAQGRWKGRIKCRDEIFINGTNRFPVSMCKTQCLWGSGLEQVHMGFTGALWSQDNPSGKPQVPSIRHAEWKVFPWDNWPVR